MKRAFVSVATATCVLAVVSNMVQSQPQTQAAQVESYPSAAPQAVPPPPPNPDQQALELFKPVEQIARSWLQRPELQQSQVGLEIMDIPSGRVLFSHQGRKRFVSASTAKVFTNACAYDLLGGGYTYKTTLYGYGEIHNGKLTGPLVLVPSQDPSFSSNSLSALASAASTKINSVAGEVYVGQIPGGGDFFATEWLIQDWGQDWMPPSSDFVLDRNVASFKNLSHGYPLITTGSDNEHLALTRSLLKGPWASAWVTFNKSNNSVTFHRPDGALQNEPVVANPTEYNAAALRAALKSSGIKVGGKDLPTTGSPIVISQDVSPPLSKIVTFCLENSDNLYAQQLLRTVGALPALNSKLENASLEDRGLARMSYWLSSQCGVPPSEAILFDGCGLSRKDAVSPHALNLVLRHMAGADGNGPFLELLKKDNDASAKSFRYKTGAMDSVRSITGIVRTSTGQPIAVTAIINSHTPSVRELRTSLMSLVSKIESLGSLKLKPMQPNKPKAAAKPRTKQIRTPARSTARRTTSRTTSRTRKTRRHR